MNTPVTRYARSGGVFDKRGTGLSDRVPGYPTLDFEDHGIHSLKGVPGEWRVFAAS